MPQQGRDRQQRCIDDLARRAAPGLEGMPSARYFGFVIGGHLDAALAADKLTAAWDQNATLAASTPAAAACEEVVGRQLASVLGLPVGVSFALVTGGMMANFTCARGGSSLQCSARHGWDHEIDGLQGAPRVRLVAGAERHSTIDRALRYLGFGSASIELVDVDDHRARCDPSRSPACSRRSRRADDRVRASRQRELGWRSTRSAQICDIAHEHGAWVHVDGAFGLWAAASPQPSAPRRRDSSKRTRGRPTRTSGSTCPTTAASASPRIRPTTRRRSGSAPTTSCSPRASATPMDFTPEASRRARAFSVWAALQSLGRDGVADLVDRCCDRAQQFAELPHARSRASRSRTTWCSTRSSCGSPVSTGVARGGAARAGPA